MTAEAIDDLLDHLERTTRLSRSEAARVVAEIASFFSESTEEFVARLARRIGRRHFEVPGATFP